MTPKKQTKKTKHFLQPGYLEKIKLKTILHQEWNIRL